MQSSTRQPSQKGPDSAAMDLALRASDVLLATTTTRTLDDEPDSGENSFSSSQPPLMHFPHCRIEISQVDYPTTSSRGFASTTTCKLEQIALPGPLVRTLLSRFEGAPPQPQPHHNSQRKTQRPPSKSTTSTPSTTSPQQQHTPSQRRPIQIQPHFDDNDDWVFSRCLLADFTGFRDDEAEMLSSQGRLCCWASVVLQPQQGHGQEGDGDGERGGGGKWELGFIVQRVGVKDPGSGWCECF